MGFVVDRHVKVAGWLNIVLGLCGVGLGLYLLLDADRGGGGWIGERRMLALFFGAVLLALALPYVVAGVGLVRGWRWARYLAVIVGILSILWFPLGTPVGVYTLWALWRSGSDARMK